MTVQTTGPINLGVIGYGERAKHIAALMCARDPQVRLAAIADPNSEKLCLEMQAAGGDKDIPRFFDSADEMLDRALLDGVLVGTRCGLHAAMGVKVLKRNLALFLEKPVATRPPDLLALREAAGQHPDAAKRTVVSFPLRLSPLVRLARKIIDAGTIGTVEHAEAWNDVPYGNVYFQTWYRDEAETQGMFLQKATHDFDYLNFLLAPRAPLQISAMTSKQVFRGTHPAGLHCTDCAERTVCHESPYHPSRPEPVPLDQPAKEMCAFAVDTGNEDSGSALIRYDSGMHVSYSQNFVVRGKAARRGARLIGYHGTLEFDWYTERLQVFHHHSSQVETHTFDPSADGHGGGDDLLAANFVQVIRGTEESISTLDNGIQNALLCLKAREAARTGTLQSVEFSEC